MATRRTFVALARLLLLLPIVLLVGATHSAARAVRLGTALSRPSAFPPTRLPFRERLAVVRGERPLLLRAADGRVCLVEVRRWGGLLWTAPRAWANGCE
jgi:hypothetical protein